MARNCAEAGSSTKGGQRPARKTEKLQRDGDGGKAGASGFHWLFGSDSEPYFLLAFSRWRILRGGKRGRGKGGGGGERESGDVQVPRGWDKLFVSIVSVETGKTIAKSSRTAVHGGTCQWTDSFSESIWVSQDGATKELEECLYKIVVAMGSSRSGVLGDVALNLTDYVHSRDSGLLSLPLERCNYGTILQIKVQCLSRTKSRFRVMLILDGKGWKETNFNMEEPTTNNDDVDSKSDGSDVSNRVASSCTNLAGAAHPDEPGNRWNFMDWDRSFSASGSHRSSDSGGSSVGRANFSPQSSLNGGAFNVGRPDSSGSHYNSHYGGGHSDDVSRSNHSSFNSRVSGSSNAIQLQEGQISVQGVAPVTLRSSNSCKDLLDAAEETIDELHDEVKMWERHSQKLKLDLEILKKQNSEKSKHQANLDMELSAAFAERDSFKQELEQLKLSLEESMTKQTVNGTAKVEEVVRAKKELEDELKFLKESNANLSIQLKKTQDSNLELISILQELEETVEKQTMEIANLSEQAQANDSGSGSKGRLLLDLEAEWAHKLSMKEEEIKKLEDKLSVALQTRDLSPKISSGDNIDTVKEIETLRAKVEELERDCAELTDENLELLFKMKESVLSLMLLFLNHKVRKLELELKKKDESNEDLTKSLTLQIGKLEEKCSDLENERKHLRDKVSELLRELDSSQVELEEKIQELTQLYQKQENSLAADSGADEKAESLSSLELSRILSEISKQLHIALSHVKDLQSKGESGAETECLFDSEFLAPGGTDAVTQKDQVDNMIKSFVKFNDMLESKLVECRVLIQFADGDRKQQDQNSVEAKKWLKDNLLYEQEFGAVEAKENSRNGDTHIELIESQSMVEELKAVCSSKDEQIDDLRNSNRELDDLLSDIRREKDQLEEQLNNALGEINVASNSLEDARHEVMMLKGSVDSHASANKMLEKKLVELESSKNELDVHISELENENVQLSERISGLEAQLRYLTNEKESNRLELDDSKAHIADLKDQLSSLQTEMDSQKLGLEQKLQEAQKRLAESQEESELLKRAQSKQQGTIENLMEECVSLQKSTADLKKQKLDLHGRNSRLEVELGESLKKSADFCEKVEFLEGKLSLLQKDIILKENLLATKLENVYKENKELEERIRQAHILLNQLDEEVKLERAGALLTAQASSAHNEEAITAAESSCESSNMLSDRRELETSLQEAQEKIKWYETELNDLKQESDNKIQGLVDLLNVSKQSEEMLMIDITRMQRLIENIKSSEERFKRTANDLELKLKASDYEKEQITEEITGLKLQVQKVALLQDEIMALKTAVDDAKFEKGKLEELLKSVSEECEELKTEKISFVDKVSNMQQALHGFEDDRLKRIALEEKLSRLESDLTAKEALFAQEAEIKNELNRMKRVNSEYQRKVQNLEDEKEEFTRITQELEKELLLRKEQSEVNKVSIEDGNNPHKENQGDGDKVDLKSKIQSLETELAEALEASSMYRIQLQSLVAEKENNQAEILKKSPENEANANQTARISSLEAELKDMQERYLNMSLKFAEVEAQREQLVMKLKSTNKEKRWF
ncbi:myosin-3-like [Dioscorea cayenensis subsp. rotundata]|uniref:Myosin-3-like n=1 Tax=Dioscorea cayennensis subsp. rotundata TaxID=55577 RepID=A0AB40CBW7_DIOCR|nr:myosin-3-like [Dioscorea cayenensis subsp. rotundata]